jgi:ABC-type nitrate/sulfonate/bicarbonate transport system permease component
MFIFRKTELLMKIAVPVIFLIVWELVARFVVKKMVLIPPASHVFESLYQMTMSGEIFVHSFHSILRVLSGFFIAASVGIPVGFMMGWYKYIDKLLDTSVHMLRPIPATAWVPASILFFGVGNRPALFLVFIGTVWPLLLNTISGIKSVDRIYIWAAQTMGAREKDLLRKVVLPAALPEVFTGVRIAMGVAWTCVIVAELLAVRSGLGYLIMESRLIVRPDKVFAGMVMIAIIGLGLDYSTRVTMSVLLKWRKGLKLE